MGVKVVGFLDKQQCLLVLVVVLVVVLCVLKHVLTDCGNAFEHSLLVCLTDGEHHEVPHVLSKDDLEQKGVSVPKLCQSKKAKQRQVRIVRACEINALGGVEELSVKIKNVHLVVKKAIFLQERRGHLGDLAEPSRGQVDCDGRTGGRADGAVREKGVLGEVVCGRLGPLGDKDLLVLADPAVLARQRQQTAPLGCPKDPKGSA